MKKINFLMIIVLFGINSIWAQEEPPLMREGRHSGRLAELEKIKLIETLQMDEETTLRFFSRRSEHMLEQKKLMKERKELLEELEIQFKNEESLTDEEYQAKIDQLVESEKIMLENRIKFANSLDDILSYEQIAKLAVFEFSFMKEVRKVMRRGRGKGEYK